MPRPRSAEIYRFAAQQQTRWVNASVSVPVQSHRSEGSRALCLVNPMGKAPLCSALWELNHWFYRQGYRGTKQKQKSEHESLIVGRFTPGTRRRWGGGDESRFKSWWRRARGGNQVQKTRLGEMNGAAVREEKEKEYWESEKRRDRDGRAWGR